MCVVSMVTDHFRTYPTEKWDWEKWSDYEELKRKAKLYDELSKQPDCEDPSKQEFEKLIKKLLEDKYGLRPMK